MGGARAGREAGAGLRVTVHAAERYVERVKPWLSVGQARRELLSMLGGTPGPAPGWMGRVRDEDARYLEPSEGIVLVVVGRTVVTVETRTSRVGVKASRELRKQHRRAARFRGGVRGRRPVAKPSRS